MPRQIFSCPFSRPLFAILAVIAVSTACSDSTPMAAPTPSSVAFAVTDPLTDPTVFVEEIPSWFACDEERFFVDGLSPAEVTEPLGLDPSVVTRDEIVGTGPSCLVGNRLAVILNRGDGVTFDDSRSLNTEVTDLSIGGHRAFAGAQFVQVDHQEGLLQLLVTGEGDPANLAEVALVLVTAIHAAS